MNERPPEYILVPIGEYNGVDIEDTWIDEDYIVWIIIPNPELNCGVIYVRLWCDSEQVAKLRQAGLKVIELKNRDYVIVVATKEQVENVLDSKEKEDNGS